MHSFLKKVSEKHIMIPVHFHDVTNDKMKSNFVKNNTTLEPLLNHFKSGNSHLSCRTYLDNYLNLNRTRESSCGFEHV